MRNGDDFALIEARKRGIHLFADVQHDFGREVLQYDSEPFHSAVRVATGNTTCTRTAVPLNFSASTSLKCSSYALVPPYTVLPGITICDITDAMLTILPRLRATRPGSTARRGARFGFQAKRPGHVQRLFDEDKPDFAAFVDFISTRPIEPVERADAR